MTTPLLNLSDHERERLETLAQRRGFQAADDYLKALVDADAAQMGEDLPFDEDEVDIRAEFKQAWHEAMTGKTMSIEDMWKAIDEG